VTLLVCPFTPGLAFMLGIVPLLRSHDGVSPIRVQTALAGPRASLYPYDLASSIL